MPQPEPELIAVIGPTAAGKSERAMALAPRVGGEIISADSRHVYRGMNIGTNKPSPADRRNVPHHLLDLREPHESFSLAEYVALARAAIADVRARGRTPLLVGGTGQYIRAILQGWAVPPVPPDAAAREKWERLAAERGPDALFEALTRLDPAAAASIDRRNVRRVVRALEVMEATGARWSDLQRREPLGLAVQLIHVDLPRDVLYARADARLQRMVDVGWLDEVRALLARLAERGFDAAAAARLPAMSALGYREMIAVAEGARTLDDALIEIRRATRRFIRMQDTWIRAELVAAANM